MPAPVQPLEREQVAIPGGTETSDEEAQLAALNEWVVSQGVPPGEMLVELADPERAEPIAVLDLAWPDGLQEGLSQPVALLINEGPETEEAANRCGFRFFRNHGDFRGYVRREILTLEEGPLFTHPA